jgi:hypothetical protein
MVTAAYCGIHSSTQQRVAVPFVSSAKVSKHVVLGQCSLQELAAGTAAAAELICAAVVCFYEEAARKPSSKCCYHQPGGAHVTSLMGMSCATLSSHQ